MASLSGKEFTEVCDAIMSAFDRDDFDMLLYEWLNYDRRLHVADGSFRKVVFDVLRDLQNKGMERDLIAAVAARRPHREDVQQIFRKYAQAVVSESVSKGVDADHAKAIERYDLVKGVEIQKAGHVTTSQAEAARAGLERTVRKNVPYLDVQLWLRLMLRLQGKVCRMEVDQGAAGTSFGTGFLVGPDLLLTNYHVVEPIVDGDNDGSSIVARFDYAETAQGPTTGLPVPALQDGWLVAHGSYTQEEKDGYPDQAQPAAAELDFALVRLSRPVGAEPLFPDLPEGVKRGWLPLPTAAPAIQKDMPLLILQHPENAPLKLAVDTQSVIGLRCGGRRLRYRTNTEAGSSGAPVFDIHGQLVALHHLGFPVWPANAPGEYNQGVPIAAIYQHLKTLGLGPQVSSPSPDTAAVAN